jgi:hypothetical protein
VGPSSVEAQKRARFRSALSQSDETIISLLQPSHGSVCEPHETPFNAIAHVALQADSVMALSL